MLGCWGVGLSAFTKLFAVGDSGSVFCDGDVGYTSEAKGNGGLCLQSG
ncbi:MAG: hypothetical protein HOI47_12120 [Candidatus Scalindua sp.]|nr:hypothetical protein [Candidatus Scalindua sp.]MBT5305725.1 hypothetical protein [Candidatus Scalindua sp.]MBT6227394.1 hypothetical protein [Candidatus Scalindua sp.]MBT7211704.1 hypothetical protein [Candidatus Scalindua sp.]